MLTTVWELRYSTGHLALFETEEKARLQQGTDSIARDGRWDVACVERDVVFVVRKIGEQYDGGDTIEDIAGSLAKATALIEALRQVEPYDEFDIDVYEVKS